MSGGPDLFRLRLQKRIAKAYRNGRLSYAYYLETCLRAGLTPSVPCWGDLKKGKAYP